MRRLAIALLALCGTASQAVPQFTGFPPTGGPLTGQEWLPADGAFGPERFKTNQMTGQSFGVGVSGNVLIAGDASQNLWQRNTTGGGPLVSSTLLFGPDRWAYWAAAGTQMVVSRSTNGVTPGFQYSYKMARANTSAGTAQMCMVQEVSSANSVQLSQKIVEFDFGVRTGADFSANAIALYLVTGTGQDEGVIKMAFGLNGQGGGTVGWTGQGLAASAGYSGMGPSSSYHPVAVTFMPPETEVAAVVCWTGSGTAGADDAIYLTGLQVRIAPYLQARGALAPALDASEVQVPGFVWRSSELEALLQEQYLAVRWEGAGVSPVAGCADSSGSSTECFVKFPVIMRKVPVMTYGAGFQVDQVGGGMQACVALATVGQPSTIGVLVGCTASNPTPVAGFMYEAGGSGLFMADGELY